MGLIDRTGASRNARAAKRQADYRARQQVLARSIDELFAALSDAVDATGCSWLMNRLGDGREEQLAELTKRLSSARIIAVRVRETPSDNTE